MKNFCARCFWRKVHVSKLPYPISPGIFSSIDSYTNALSTARSIITEVRPPGPKNLAISFGYLPHSTRAISTFTTTAGFKDTHAVISKYVKDFGYPLSLKGSYRHCIRQLSLFHARHPRDLHVGAFGKPWPGARLWPHSRRHTRQGGGGGMSRLP